MNVTKLVPQSAVLVRMQGQSSSAHEIFFTLLLIKDKLHSYSVRWLRGIYQTDVKKKQQQQNPPGTLDIVTKQHNQLGTQRI